jgi:hypothetical protein
VSRENRAAKSGSILGKKTAHGLVTAFQGFEKQRHERMAEHGDAQRDLIERWLLDAGLEL